MTFTCDDEESILASPREQGETQDLGDNQRDIASILVLEKWYKASCCRKLPTLVSWYRGHRSTVELLKEKWKRKKIMELAASWLCPTAGIFSS